MDESAHARFESVIRAHAGGVVGYLRYLGCDAATTDDITQETFMAFLSKGAGIRETSATSAWLRATARNLYLTHARKERRREELLELEIAERVWAANVREPDASDYMIALEHCLETLEEQVRAVLRMRFKDGLNGAEIGSRVNLTEAGVNTLIHRGKEQLRQCIERRVRA